MAAARPARFAVTLIIGVVIAIGGGLAGRIQAASASDAEFAQVVPAAKAVSYGNVTPRRLTRASREPDQWFTGGRDGEFSYYSPLDQINETNVARLGFAWSHALDTPHGLEATPVVVDGVMYTSGPWGFVYALDAKSGKPLWTFDPRVDPAVARHACCDIVNRGVLVWRGQVYVGTLDGRLVALDAATGVKRWEVDTIVDHERGYTITGAPYIAGDLVVIGNSGAEYDARGYVSAYRAAAGSLAWRFFTVPASRNGPFEHPELAAAAKTWPAQTRWEVGLGGTAWDAMAYDPQLDLLYVGTGNSALFPRSIRSPGGGDNLFVSSILAIRAKTGRLIWHYQTTPADQWDYTATQKIIFATLRIDGRDRKVLMQAPKNGFFYILDRATGQLLSASPYARVTWASGVDLRTGRPIETTQADYNDGPKLIFPSPAGAHTWHPMSFSASTRLVYIPVLDAPAVFWIPPEPFEYRKGGVNMGVGIAFPTLEDGNWGLKSDRAARLPPLDQLARGQPEPSMRGYLRAWDPIGQRVAWEVETSASWAGRMNALWNGGGVMSTAGNLVFQGRSTGELFVYAADNGRLLHQVDLGTGVMAAPMTYATDGTQYVAVMAGSGGLFGRTHFEGTAARRYGNAGRIIVLKLDGAAVPKPEPASAIASKVSEKPPLDRFGSESQIALGRRLLERHCTICHSNTASSGIPDLRRMTSRTHAEFDQILLQGTRSSKGMSSFAGLLSVDDVHALHAAVVDAAWRMYETSIDQK